MFGLASIVFLAALIGVIKPYLKQLSRKQFGGAAAVAFVVMMVTVPPSDQNETAAAPSNEAATLAAAPASVDNGQQAAAEPAAPATKWRYSEDRDQMRGTTTKFAMLDSENEVDLDWPYGDQTGTITIRRRPSDGLNVMLSVASGQILCRSYGESHISAKFDDGPVQNFSCTDSSDGSSETAFVVNEARFLAALKRSRRAIVEAEFYQKGRQQFTFETAGLEWE